ncbi:MAG: pilus assembly protein PilM [Planctomycetota bacterium]|jgi:Tfp pilus assembly PilM family ATPase
MVGKAVAVDPGSHGVRVVAVKDGKTGLALTRFAAFAAKEQAGGLIRSGIPLKGVVCGLAGRDMTLRYTQVPPSPDWQLRNLMELEIQELSSQSGDQLSADYNLLPVFAEDADSETVLMALARNEALERVNGMVTEANGSIAAHVPNCIAIYNAYLRAGPVEEDAVVCLANIGHETMDIALVKGVDLLFARNLSGGGRVLNDAITAAFNVGVRKAEILKKDLLDLDPESRGKYASGQAEKVTMAAGGAANMLSSAIQSSVAFCKSQTGIQDLRLDKILISGGSARLRGIRGRLREDLRCPVEVFDPFQNVDLSGLSEEDRQELDQNRSGAVVALGLAAGAADDTLYSLEILPEAVKRRQRLLQRTVYNVAAVLVAVVVLAVFAASERNRLDAMGKHYNSLKKKRARVVRTHKDAEELAQHNQLQRGVADLLAERSLPLDGTLHVLRALQQNLEPEFWLKTLRIKPKTNRPRGSKPRNIVLIEGYGKEIDRNLSTAYVLMVKKIKALPNVGKVTQLRQNQTGDRYVFTLEFDLLGRAEEQRAKAQDKGNDKDSDKDK